MQTNLIQQIADAIVPQEVKKEKFHLVMMFFSASELGIPCGIPGYTPWINTRNHYFDNIGAALDCYANTRCSASQLISAASEEELEMKKQQMLDNYSDEKWLEENLYPYM
jgi:hypothetical protein